MSKLDAKMGVYHPSFHPTKKAWKNFLPSLVKLQRFN